MAEAVIVLTTAPDAKHAEDIARRLVEQRLAACVNVCAPMISYYRWKGAIERDEEHQLVIKTVAAQVDAVEACIKALHPYEVPELLVIPIVDGGRSYLDWLIHETEA
jgi:periplasmic divalent cation tolerance protein